MIIIMIDPDHPEDQTGYGDKVTDWIDYKDVSSSPHVN